MKFEGKTIKYGDNVDTDVIIPARYLNTSDPKELAKHCMEDIDKEFAGRVAPGDIMLGGKNFGCGSSREHAPIAIKASGIRCVVAESFARIFYRNAINIGLPILECPEICSANDGDKLRVDLDNGVIYNLTQQSEYASAPFPPFMQEIMNQGGLIGYIKSSVEEESNEV